MPINPKKSLATFSLTSCGGCLEVLNENTNRYSGLQNFYEIERFLPNKIEKKYDIVIIEGHPLTEKQIGSAKLIRRQAKIVVALGSCAHIGGVYDEMVTLLPKEKRARKLLSEIVRVDYIVPGCPPDQAELTRCLMDLYWGKIFCLPDLAVCFECRQNENVCLIKKNKLCLGPITRMGCNSICVNNGEACLGCRGLKPDANIRKMTEILKPIIPEFEAKKIMSIFGNLDAKQ
ncbi:MAG: hypothetical protein Q7S80_01870 [bacterium]|nr:hypothetical protein [bacterium]